MNRTRTESRCGWRNRIVRRTLAGARTYQIVSIPVNTTDNSQIKNKGEGKRSKIGATLSPGWWSELGPVVPGQEIKMTTRNSS